MPYHIVKYWCLLLLILPVHVSAQEQKIPLSATISIADAEKSGDTFYVRFSVNSRGSIYLLDSGLNRLVKINQQGAILKEIGGFGWGDVQFDQATDIWARNALNVFVVDHNNHRIQHFDRNLNFIASINNDSALPDHLQFAFPIAMVFSMFGELFLIEGENKRVLHLDAQFKPLRSFGSFDWGEGALQEPAAIGLSAQQEVFVYDMGQNAIIIFDYFGNFDRIIPIKKRSESTRMLIMNKHIYLADSTGMALDIYNNDGSEDTRYSFAHHLTKGMRIRDFFITDQLFYVLAGEPATIYVFKPMPSGEK